MSLVDVDNAVMGGIYDHLSDPVSGFNPRLQSLSDILGPINGFVPFTIDFTQTSNNFMFGDLPANLIESSTYFQPPLITIDTLTMEHTNLVTSATFAGVVTAVVQVILTWPAAIVIPDFARASSLVTSAVVDTLNDPENQQWPSGVIWSGHVILQKSPILAAGSNWRRAVTIYCKMNAVF